jgi:hypothetical protein
MVIIGLVLLWLRCRHRTVQRFASLRRMRSSGSNVQLSSSDYIILSLVIIFCEPLICRYRGSSLMLLQIRCTPS